MTAKIIPFPAPKLPAKIERRWIKTADVAKLIRKQLKVKFPGQKFSVRSSSYAGGSSISVDWIDGPVADEVRKVTDPFAGSGFDGMIDLKYGKDSLYCEEHGAQVASVYGHTSDNGPADKQPCCDKAEPVRFGVDFVFPHRELSPELTATLARRVRRDSGMPEEGPLDERLPQNSRWQYYPYDTVLNGVRKMSGETTH